MQASAALSAANPAAGHRGLTSPPESPGHSRASLGLSFVGSVFLSPGFRCTQGFVCALQESVSPILCKFSCLFGGLMPASSKRAYADPGLLHPEPLPLQQSTADPYPTGYTQAQFCLSFCGVSGSFCTQGLFEPSEHLWWVWGLILNMILPLLLSFWVSPLLLDVGYLLKVTLVPCSWTQYHRFVDDCH